MRVFVAGATGAVGRRLVPQLVAAGHSVVGSTRSQSRAQELRELGAEPAVMDPLDRESVRSAVGAAQPEVLVHELTALANIGANMRRFERDFALTNWLRTEGTDHLMEAARESGVRRVVAQSFGGWTYAREGGPVKTEEDPLDPDPPRIMRGTLDAIRHLESAVTGAEGVEGLVLRYGTFYGPENAIGRGGLLVEQVRKRRLPIVGSGDGVWSFAHIDDVATATALAVDRGGPGVYNVADDEPAPASEWLPYLAEAIGAKPPLRVPVWIGRLAGGEVVVSVMTRIRGASNAKAKRELGWEPRWGTWREGFRRALG